MSASVVALPRRQPTAHAARVAATAVKPDTLTQPQLAMLRQQIQTFRHLAALAVQMRAAVQSHGLTLLDSATDRIRADAAAGVEAIYRAAAAAPDSPLDHVRADKLELVAECEEALGLNKRAAAA